MAKLKKKCIRSFYTIHTITLFPFKKKPVRSCKERMPRKTNRPSKYFPLSQRSICYLQLFLLRLLCKHQMGLAGGKSNQRRRRAWVARPIHQTEGSTFHLNGFFKTKDQFLVCNSFWAAYFTSNRWVLPVERVIGAEN